MIKNSQNTPAGERICGEFLRDVDTAIQSAKLSRKASRPIGSFSDNWRMIALDTVSVSEFEACLQEKFTVVGSEGELPLTLAKVTRLDVRHPEAKRDPFTLIFHAENVIRLAQGIYLIRHPKLGEAQIFLVQVSPQEVEAVFN